MAGPSKEEVEKSPFVEHLLTQGDEYAISALPEFEGKKF